mgnify:CR=1 FL=1
MNVVIESITDCGFCELFAESRYTSGKPFTSRSNIGNCFLIVAASSVLT